LRKGYRMAQYEARLSMGCTRPAQTEEAIATEASPRW